MKPHEIRTAAHFAQVHTVQRRSAWERVLAKIAFYEAWDRADGLTLGPSEREQLRNLYEMGETIRKELVEAGQINAPLT